MTNQFNPGQTVRIRTDLEVGKRYGKQIFYAFMDKYKGQTVTIKRQDDRTDQYSVKENGWYWSPEQLEAVPEEREYPIGGYAPGNYENQCVSCKELFIGDKLAVQCEPCAVKIEQEYKDSIQPVPEDKAPSEAQGEEWKVEHYNEDWYCITNLKTFARFCDYSTENRNEANSICKHLNRIASESHRLRVENAELRKMATHNAAEARKFYAEYNKASLEIESLTEQLTAAKQGLTVEGLQRMEYKELYETFKNNTVMIHVLDFLSKTDFVLFRTDKTEKG